MAVTSTTKKVTGAGNGVATAFSFSPMVIQNADQLLVTLVAADGTETVLSRGTGASAYSVSVPTFPGTGSITYPEDAVTPIATGVSVVMTRNVTLDQQTVLRNQGGYFAKTQEAAFDKLTMIDLQQQEEIDRSLKLSVSADAIDTEIVGFAAELFVAVNEAGDGFEFTAGIPGPTGPTGPAGADGSGVPGDATPIDVSLSAAVVGVSTDFSREDHAHLLPTVTVAKGGTGAVTAAAARTNLGVDTAALVFVVDGGGSALTTGTKLDLYVPFACTITAQTLLADQSGSIVVDLWKDVFANHPATVADTITASAKPTIVAGVSDQDSTLTGWTTAVAAGDVIRLNIDSVTTITRITLVLEVTKV